MLRAFIHYTDTIGSIVSVNNSVSHDHIRGSPHTDRISIPCNIIITVAVEVLKESIIRLVQLETLTSRLLTSRILSNNICQFRTWRFDETDASRSILCLDIVDCYIIGFDDLDVGTIIAKERLPCGAWLCSPLITISINLNILKVQIVCLECIDAHTICCMNYQHISDCHIISSDPQRIVVLSGICTGGLRINDHVFNDCVVSSHVHWSNHLHVVANILADV